MDPSFQWSFTWSPDRITQSKGLSSLRWTKPGLHTRWALRDPGPEHGFGNYRTRSAFLTLQTITRHLVKMQILIRQTWERSGTAFLTRSQVMLMPLVHSTLGIARTMIRYTLCNQHSLKVSGRENTELLTLLGSQQTFMETPVCMCSFSWVSLFTFSFGHVWLSRGRKSFLSSPYFVLHISSTQVIFTYKSGLPDLANGSIGHQLNLNGR